MRVSGDLTLPVIVHATQLPSTSSPAAGVDRLFRIGEEVARATSIVRYAPSSSLPRHPQGGGEEIVVLDGVFHDEHGDNPAGSYFHNPPGTSHIPASKDGCTIFVGLSQFRADDCAQIVRRPAGGRARRVQLECKTTASRTSVFENWLLPGKFVTIENARGLERPVSQGACPSAIRS